MINWHRLINNEVKPNMNGGETLTALTLIVERYNDNMESLYEFLEKRGIVSISNGTDLLAQINRCKIYSIALCLLSLFLISCTTSLPKITPSPIPINNTVPLPSIVPDTTTFRKPDNFCFWLDNKPETSSFTNCAVLQWDEINEENLARLKSEGRKAILWMPFFSYGPTERSTGGYYLDQASLTKFESKHSLLLKYLDIILYFYLADEPPDVAWGDKGTSSYDPNLYNWIIDYSCNVIHNAFPSFLIALNYGSVPDGLVVPKCLDVVLLEAYYGKDVWLPRLNKLKSLTNAKLGLLPQAFNENNYTDELLYAWANEVIQYSLTDKGVEILQPFLYCIDKSSTCEDLANGVFTIGGATNSLPKTKQLFIDWGKSLK